MKLRENRLMLIWLFCVGVMFFGCVVAYFQGWWGMINAGDHSKLSFVSFGLFLIGLAINGKNALWINREFKNAVHFSQLSKNPPLKGAVLNAAWKDSDHSLVSQHIINLHQIADKQKNGEVDQSALIEIMVAEYEVKESWTRHIAMTLASLGLLGTLVGFVMSMSGLDTMMSMDKTAMISGLSTAIHGMTTAFYATIIAVIFGALFLELLHRLVINTTTKLLVVLAKLGEVYVIPSLKFQYANKTVIGESGETPQ